VTISISISSPRPAEEIITRPYSIAPSYEYVPALDGVRAVSILMVIISHYGSADLIPGGFGVNIFFFISGLLISRQLSVELAKRGRLSFGKFYLRRVARLFPALLLMIPASSALYVAVGKHASLPEVLAALFYFTNYYSYFIGFHQPDHPFIILWSLAVEEHFYLFFPLLIALFFRRSAVYVFLLVAILVAEPLWRFYLHNLCAVDFSTHPVCGILPAERIYGGTDTRADALLYGVLLTELLRGKSAHRILAILANPLIVAGGVLLILASLLVRTDEFRDVYRYTLQSLGLMPIIASVVFTNRFKWVRWLLETKPAILIGRWSYSLYLYHWVAMTVAAGVSGQEFSLTWYCVAIPLCLSLSLFSYYAIEMPVVSLRRRLGSHVVTSTGSPQAGKAQVAATRNGQPAAATE